MAVNLSPFGGVGAQFLDNSGNVLTGGKIFTYAAGTTTNQATYTSSLGNTPLPNPIILNAAGRVPTGEIWLTDGLSYKFVLTDSNDVLIGTYDNIIGINSNFVAFTNQQEIQTATAGQTVFNLANVTYQPNTNSLSVFVDGVNQYGPGAQYAYFETDSDTVTFVSGLHVGAQVKFTTSALTTGNATNASVVAYDPPFTGAVSTNVEAKLAEIVSVKDFGADPSDLVGDTNLAAFNAALAASNYIVVPNDGTYKINGTIVITGIKTIAGYDGGSQAGQPSKINHVGVSGSLFSATSGENGGMCIRNLNIIGGNGSFCITSNRPYARFEFIVMEPYNGGGIQLLDGVGGAGSSSSQILNCQWVGPASPTNYTGFELDINGGDVLLHRCTAIRGALGINIIKGQTVVIDQCSLNQQTRNPNVSGGAKSSAAQFDTAAIKLSGTDYKQAISIRKCYIETCDNGVYVESCESLSIEDNYFNDQGASGSTSTGSWTALGNSAINLVNTNARNVTIRNNNINILGNGYNAGVPDVLYGLYFNNAVNVVYENNLINRVGDYTAVYYLTTSTSVYQIANTLVTTTGTPVASYDPSNLIRTFAYEITGTFTPALSSSGATFSYAIQQGFYKKIGDLVWFSLDIQLNTTGNTLTSNGLLVTGLPFQSLNIANQRNVVNAIFSNVASTSLLFTSGVVLQGDTRIQLYSPVTTGTSLAVVTSNFLSPTTGGFIGLSGWYKAQS